jgi:DNA-binding transcriptional MerR regulator
VSYSVGQVAALAHLTVRALHHYDEIGLLSPSDRSAAGYRLYSDADLERLQQILFYRELGFPLKQVAAILNGGATDAASHLRTQHRLLRERIDQLQAMLGAIDKTLEARHMGVRLTPEERFEVFGTFVPEDYDQEVRERWKGTSEFEESQRRVSQYTKEDWTRMKAAAEENGRALVEAMKDGVAPESDRAMALAEQHREHISRWFYECSDEIHRGLGEMYVADPRFTAFYDRMSPGLATYLRDAIVANAARRAR